MQSIKSTCPYCGVGCGIKVDLNNPSNTLVLGDEEHPANFGRLCSKGSALSETLLDADQGQRLTHPTIAGQEVSWHQATQTIADRILASIEEHGRDSIAFYLSGQLLTEDYYVANKLMKGFIGSANVDTNSRLCMSSAVAAHKRAFGSDTVPCSYEDIDKSELIVLIGSNAAWTHPVLYQRMVAAKQANPNLKVVLIDPRKTASCDIADLHLAIKPSSDGFLFQGLLRYLIGTDSIDKDYIERHTDGFSQAKESVQQFSLIDIADQTAVDQSDLLQFFEWFAKTKNVISFYSQGINQSTTGTDKCNAIINCHLATGKIGYEGAGPFSITGQPNAMGGREVGGLANQLAAHMDFNHDDCDRVQRFWQSSRIATKPGLKAVELFNAVADGQIKVIWIMATNPAVSLPDSNQVRKALKLCPTVIVSDITHTDTTAYADITLPAQGWSEKDGTVTNSERRISRQRAFRTPPGEAKADWWAIKQVATRLGFEKHFNYQNAHQIFLEHSKLSGFENEGSRSFDISGLSAIRSEEYDNLKPTQWPINSANPSGQKRMFSDGKFFTDNGRAKFVSGNPRLANCVEASNNVDSFILNTGRLRDHWHTMTRTGQSPSLTSHHDLPIVQMNSADADKHGLKNNQLLSLSSQHGKFIASLELGDQVKKGELFSAIHWNEQFATTAVVTSAIGPEVDPVSGQPEFKASAVTVTPFECTTWARVATHHPISRGTFKYWAQTKTKLGYVTLIGSDDAVDWRQWSESQINSNASFTQYSDDTNNAQTIIAAQSSTIELLLYSQKSVEKLPSFSWLSSSFDTNDTNTLAGLLRSEKGGQDKQICSCFGVSRKAIENAAKDGISTIDELGVALGCGSKCGSCRPELNQIIHESLEQQKDTDFQHCA